MKKRMLAGALCLVLTLSASLSLSGCSTAAQAIDLMDGVSAGDVIGDIELTGSEDRAIADFAVQLFKNSGPESKNTLVSPFSVLCALAMTANGAGGDTLAQMQETFGLSIEELNTYLRAYLDSLASGEKYKLSVANSLWFRDDESLVIEKDFLQKNADYYNASLYQSAFDKSTLEVINDWVSEKTDGMIDGILDEIPEEAVMYLINALAFDAEWENIYRESQVQEGTFTTESGEIRDVEMMYCQENRYLDDGSATGFIKYYADRKYAFAALLPNPGISIADYAASLTGGGLSATLENAQDIRVDTALPKFESEYAVEMSDMLKAMGMTDAFDPDRADFSGMGHMAAGNLFISRVLHKTYIAVDEKGTKAGAVTSVEMRCTSAAPPEEFKTVYLDRPFVYMLIDCETNLPIFIGTVMDIH